MVKVCAYIPAQETCRFQWCIACRETMFGADENMNRACCGLSLGTGVLLISVILLLFGAYALTVAFLWDDWNFWAVAFVVVNILISCAGLYGLILPCCQSPKGANMMGKLMLILEIFVLLSLIIRWVFWGIALHKDKDLRTGGVISVMVIYTLLALFVVFMVDHGRNVFASVSKRWKNGISIWTNDETIIASRSRSAGNVSGE